MSVSFGIFVTYLAARPIAVSLNLNIEFVAQVLGFLTMQGMALIWVSMFLAEQDLTWNQAFGFRNAPGRSTALAVAITAIALPVALIVLGGLVALLFKLFGETPEQQITVSFLRNHPPPWQIAVMGFTAIVLAPIAEETLFRGILYTAIKQRGHRQAAIWGTSILFALIHFNLSALVPLIFLGLVWTWLYERTQNLIAPIVGHMLFNAINFIAIVTGFAEWAERLFKQ